MSKVTQHHYNILYLTENNMKRLLITDLDDTLYDWLGFFIPSFYAMVDEVVSITGISKSTLLAEYKDKHQYYGSVEYPFVTLKLPSIINHYKGLSENEIKCCLEEAFHRFNSVRKENLSLYEGVKSTIEKLYNDGITIIGYTESSQENGFFRLERLGIAKYFKHVYASASSYESKYPISEKVKLVNTKKPNKEVLLEICKCENCSIDDAVYVGDSLTKDIYMANKAGITSVLIKHPKTENNYYQLLVDITSWTEEDFEKERELKLACESQGIKPNYIISAFDQLKEIVIQN